jgi:hypothetical protein
MEKKGIITSKATPAGVVVFATQEGLALLNKYCSVESVFTEPAQNAEGLLYPTTRMTILR